MAQWPRQEALSERKPPRIGLRKRAGVFGFPSCQGRTERLHIYTDWKAVLKGRMR